MPAAIAAAVAITVVTVTVVVPAASGMAGTSSVFADAAVRYPPGTYHPPVTAPIRDPFRRPSGPYGPGNRGVEYATTPGTRVLAIGPGTVVFAGAIAGERYVTVRHPDGLRSSYSYLATIAVREGDAVSGDTVVGLAGRHLHLGVRREEEYLDPAALWGQPSAPMRPVLVPLDGADVGAGRARSWPSGPAGVGVAAGALAGSMAG